MQPPSYNNMATLLMRVMDRSGRQSTNIEDRTAPAMGLSRGDTLMLESGYKQDARGRWIVPPNWKPYPGFSGTVIQDGIELSYTR